MNHGPEIGIDRCKAAHNKSKHDAKLVGLNGTALQQIRVIGPVAVGYRRHCSFIMPYKLAGRESTALPYTYDSRAIRMFTQRETTVKKEQDERACKVDPLLNIIRFSRPPSRPIGWRTSTANMEGFRSGSTILVIHSAEDQQYELREQQRYAIMIRSIMIRQGSEDCCPHRRRPRARVR